MGAYREKAAELPADDAADHGGPVRVPHARGRRRARVRRAAGRSAGQRGGLPQRTRFWGGPPGLSEQEVLASDAARCATTSTRRSWPAARLAVTPVPDARGRRARPARAAGAPTGARCARRSDCWVVTPPAAGPAVADVMVATADRAVDCSSAPRGPKRRWLAGRYFDEPVEALGTVPAGAAGSVAIPPDTRADAVDRCACPRRRPCGYAASPRPESGRALARGGDRAAGGDRRGGRLLRPVPDRDARGDRGHAAAAAAVRGARDRARRRRPGLHRRRGRRREHRRRACPRGPLRAHHRDAGSA